MVSGVDENMDDGNHHETRSLEIAGCHNLRDLGGHLTQDGRTVRGGVLFRSGVIAPATEEDATVLRGLGISAIYDLRANRERAYQLVDWFERDNISYHCHDYENSTGALHEIVLNGRLDPATARDLIYATYRTLPFEQAAAYRGLFRLLLDKRLPLLFHCTAGKDRTGIVAALILHVLGVPRSQIYQEYALTQRWTDRLLEMILRDPDYARIASYPRSHYLPLFEADSSYLKIAFEAIESRHDTIEAYLDAELGIGPAETARLREILLE
jgi:protein-tyrosine phosphatase